ncbi:MAG: hypothetical protein QNJ98_20460 [Planctomycetota bacterium]|nr:hypothetical protein [Planctomycetota bacterium]
MTEILAICVTALLFVTLGLLTRERPEPEDPCTGCGLECGPHTKEVHDARS